VKPILLVFCFLLLGTGGCTAEPRSSMLLERRRGPLDIVGPDAMALPLTERYRYGVVLGSVVTGTGERGCNGDAWLQPRGTQLADVRPIAAARLQNMFAFRSCFRARIRWAFAAWGSCLSGGPSRYAWGMFLGQ
jgi:hypothetical protein